MTPKRLGNCCRLQIPCSWIDQKDKKLILMKKIKYSKINSLSSHEHFCFLSFFLWKLLKQSLCEGWPLQLKITEVFISRLVVLYSLGACEGLNKRNLLNNHAQIYIIHSLKTPQTVPVWRVTSATKNYRSVYLEDGSFIFAGGMWGIKQAEFVE